MSIGMLLAKVSNTSNKFPYDGPDLDSTGQRVTEWTARESTDVISEKTINANDDVYALAA